MRYVVYNDLGQKVLGPTYWSPVVAEMVGLKSNLNPPVCPWAKNGHTLREVEEGTPLPFQSEGQTGTIVNEKFIPDYVDWSKEEAKEKLKADLAEFRYNKEIEGIAVDGVTYDTDRFSQMKFLGAFVRASSDPTYLVKWKSKDGFVTLDQEAMMNVALTVSHYIQDCYTRESEILADINSATDVPALRAIDITMGW